jgi:Protein of unknown function (DUF2868)
VTLTFADKLLIEQIRAMEEAFSLSAADYQPSLREENFEQALLQRAHSINLQHNLQDLLNRTRHISKRISLGLAAVAAFAGMLAVLQAITTADTTLNIYWLIIVLLGVNFISLVLWLIAILIVRPTVSGHSVLGALWRWLEPRMTSDKPRQAAADKSWLLTTHHGQAGRWWLSSLSHFLWFSYLLAALVVLLLLLMTRQFDFVWATTILSNDVFLTLTQTLATPLNWLNVITPTMEQVELSRYASEPNSGVELRQAWATFLLGAIVVYGLLPRLALFLMCRGLVSLSQKRFQLDCTQPYYIKLKQQLMPTSIQGKIVDPDTGATQNHTNETLPAHSAIIPDNAKWVAVELSDTIDWPIVAAKHNLGHITDSSSLAAVTKKLATENLNPTDDCPLTVLVSIDRLPDRGIKRVLKQLYSTVPTSKRWIAVIDQGQLDNNLTHERLNNWLNVAQQCDLPSSHFSVIKELER